MADTFPGRLDSIANDDEGALALLGKKQVLKRRFGFTSMFAFAVAELITWETVLALFSTSFENGGPAGAIYGFIIAWSSTFSVYTVISELASLAPIAGGQYYWVYMLAPPKYKTVLSYIVGWLTSLAWVATVATETLFAGTMLQGIVVLANPGYEAKLWQGTLFTWMIILLTIFINVVIPNWLPRIEIFILVFHLAGFVAIVATLWALTPAYTPSSVVWAKALNVGEWPTQGLSYCVGFLGNVATFVGADASVHLAEEVSNAPLNIPRAILGAMIINGATGFIMMVTVLYCVGDFATVLATDKIYLFIQVFLDSVGNIAGATVMSVVVFLLTWACATGILTTASRMTWSFARDNGLPASKWLSKVHPTTKIPVNAVLTVTAISALLTLIYVGSYVAFYDVVSLTITGFYGSYFLPAVLLLYHRIKGDILPQGSAQEAQSIGGAVSRGKPVSLGDSSPVEQANEKAEKDKIGADVSPGHNPDIGQGTVLSNVALIWGPWHIPGIFGIINNAYACCYMLFVIFWSVWPPGYHVDATTMNYSILISGTIMLGSAVWYFIHARKVYKGPTVDEDVIEAVVRAGSVVSITGAHGSSTEGRVI